MFKLNCARVQTNFCSVKFSQASSPRNANQNVIRAHRCTCNDMLCRMCYRQVVDLQAVLQNSSSAIPAEWVLSTWAARKTLVCSLSHRHKYSLSHSLSLTPKLSLSVSHSLPLTLYLSLSISFSPPPLASSLASSHHEAGGCRIRSASDDMQV